MFSVIAVCLFRRILPSVPEFFSTWQLGWGRIETLSRSHLATVQPSIRDNSDQVRELEAQSQTRKYARGKGTGSVTRQNQGLRVPLVDVSPDLNQK